MIFNLPFPPFLSKFSLLLNRNTLLSVGGGVLDTQLNIFQFAVLQAKTRGCPPKKQDSPWF